MMNQYLPEDMYKNTNSRTKKNRKQLKCLSTVKQEDKFWYHHLIKAYMAKSDYNQTQENKWNLT